MKRAYFPLGLSVCLLVSCQATTPLLAPGTQSESVQTAQLAEASLTPGESLPELAAVSYTPRPVPFGQIKALSNQQLEVNFTYPQAQQFKTQALSCGDVAFASITVSGPALGSQTLYANGRDATDPLFAAGGGCTASGTINAVPYGDLVIVIRLYDADRNLLAGSELQSGVRVSQANQAVEMSYRQSNLGQILKALQSGSIEDQFLASQLDLPALQGFIDSLTGVSGQFPGYLFTTHPALVNISAVLTALRANPGNIAALDPLASQYKYTPGSVSFNLSGVLAGQSVTVSLDDAVSEEATVTSDGLLVFNNLPPGNYTIRLSGAGYNNQRLPVTVSEGQTTTLPTLTILAPQPTLSSLSPTNGVSGSSLVITGSGFNITDKDNNKVKFGTTPATVTLATETQLTVTVPPGLAAGVQPVSLKIGAGQVVTGLSYTVLVPTVTGLNVSAGEIGSQVIITGTNFNPVKTNNTVKFGNATALVDSATSTQLTVTVPAMGPGPAPLFFPVGLYGSQGITVVNLQSPATASQSFAITPKITSLSGVSGSSGDTLTITGNGFNLSGAGNTVKLGQNTFTNVTTNSPTQLQVTVPSTAAGTANATVEFGGQTSVAAAFSILPKLTSLTTAEAVGSKAVLIRSQLLTLTGTNFDPIAANNTVTFSLSDNTTTIPVVVGAASALESATATQIKVLVPAGVNLAGDVGIKVTTNSKDSNALTGLVTSLNLNASAGYY